MPNETLDSSTEVDPNPSGTGSSGAALTDEALRTLAELVYQMIKAELRIERERLGRE